MDKRKAWREWERDYRIPARDFPERTHQEVMRELRSEEPTNGKIASRADAIRLLEEAASYQVDDPMAVICLDHALGCMRLALENEKNKVPRRGRPKKPRKEDEGWRFCMGMMHKEYPELGAYELARKVTDRARNDPLVVRLARWWKEKKA